MKSLIFAALLFTQTLIGFEWVAMKDRHPPEGERVLLWDNTHKIMHCGTLEEYLFYFLFTEDMEVVITFWQPLPKPPVMEQNRPMF